MDCSLEDVVIGNSGPGEACLSRFFPRGPGFPVLVAPLNGHCAPRSWSTLTFFYDFFSMDYKHESFKKSQNGPFYPHMTLPSAAANS